MNVDMILNRYVNDTIFKDREGYPKHIVSDDVQDLVDEIVRLRREIRSYEEDCSVLPEDYSVTEYVTLLKRDIRITHGELNAAKSHLVKKATENARLRQERDEAREMLEANTGLAARQTVRATKLLQCRKWLEHIYVNATSDDAGEDFRFYFEPDEILAIEAALDRTSGE